jgi:uncharacterized protein with PQ loop repeat
VAVFLLGLAIAFNIGLVVATWKHPLDFGSFLAAGEAVRTGENPYAGVSALVFEVQYEELGVGGQLVNLNPPLSVLLFSLIPAQDPLTAAAIWRLASVALYVLSLVLLRGSLPPGEHALRYLWAFALAGFWHTVELGQVYVILFFLLVLQRRSEAEGREVPAGILTGTMIALKPQLGLWILALLVTRRWRTAGASFVTFLALSLLPLPILGSEIYSQWLRATAIDPGILGLPGNSSLAGLTTRLGSYQIGLLVAAVISLAFLAKLWRIPRTQGSAATMPGILLSLFSAPIAWVGYTILLAPMLLARANWTPLVRWSAAILAVPFVIPLLLFSGSRTAFVLWGWLYGWAIVLLLVQSWKDIRAGRIAEASP